MCHNLGMEQTNPQTKTEYLTCAQTAAMVRNNLKQRFPGVKFGVRSKTYSGGSSITVDWADGPSSDEVSSVCKLYEGSTFDGMVDLKTTHTTLLASDKGVRVVHMGADYVFTQREVSKANHQKLAELALVEFAFKFATPGAERNTDGTINLEAQFTECWGRCWNLGEVASNISSGTDFRKPITKLVTNDKPGQFSFFGRVGA